MKTKLVKDIIETIASHNRQTRLATDADNRLQAEHHAGASDALTSVLRASGIGIDAHEDTGTWHIYQFAEPWLTYHLSDGTWRVAKAGAV